MNVPHILMHISWKYELNRTITLRVTTF